MTENTLAVNETAQMDTPASLTLYPLERYYHGTLQTKAGVQEVVIHVLNKTTAHVSVPDSNVPASRFSVPVEWLTPTGVKVRQIGEVPEGGLSPLDPRLAWLWEDADRLAKMRNHCREYRDMCDMLGLPGPVKDFKVTRDFKGLDVTITVKARSKHEAEELATEEMATRGLV